jgi:hypothetical protein
MQKEGEKRASGENTCLVWMRFRKEKGIEAYLTNCLIMETLHWFLLTDIKDLPYTLRDLWTFICVHFWTDNLEARLS